ARAQLDELNGCVLPYDAESVLLVCIHVRVRLEVFRGELQIVPGAKIPVAFQQSDPFAALAIGKAVIDDVVRFRQPRNRTGAQAGENTLHLSLARVRVVVVEPGAETPS